MALCTPDPQYGPLYKKLWRSVQFSRNMALCTLPLRDPILKMDFFAKAFGNRTIYDGKHNNETVMSKKIVYFVVQKGGTHLVLQGVQFGGRQYISQYANN